MTTIYVTHDQIEADGDAADGTSTAKNISICGLPTTYNGPVTLGFRAEDASVANDAAEINASVYSLELLGEATMVTMRVGNTIVSVKSGKEYRAEIDEPVHANIPADICHLFDQKTGERI